MDPHLARLAQLDATTAVVLQFAILARLITSKSTIFAVFPINTLQLSMDPHLARLALLAVPTAVVLPTATNATVLGI